MIDLGVASREETFERMADPLAARDVAVRPLQASERLLDLAREDLYTGCDVGFVYPSRLMEGAVLDAKLSIPWVNDREAVFASRNKAGALAALRAADVPTPDTVVVSNPVDESELVAAFERVGPPVVVKPNSTTRGIGVARAADLDTFLGICDYLELVHDFRATGDKAFLVQEFLPDARDVRAMTIEGSYVGAVERHVPEERRAEGRWKHNVHRGGSATGIDLEDSLRDLAEAAAAALGIDWLGVDLLLSGDRAVISETNARPTIDDAEKYEPDFYDRLADLVRRRAEDTAAD